MQDELFIAEMYRNEDAPVLTFLSQKFNSRPFSYWEVGSGLGRFPRLIKSKFPKAEILCLEINSDLAKITRKNGLKTVVGTITDPKINQVFDVVHCSHVIEHFGFPKVAQVLDEMLKRTKIGGFLIIRSPLMHPGFYKDIDHVRPYPPQSIVTYLNLKQQQRTSSFEARQVLRFERREALQIGYFYQFPLMRILNYLLKLSWIKFKKPADRPNGYVLILERTQ